MLRPEPTGRVGYVLGRFPVLSETFVLNEILGLEAHGMDVEVFSLTPATDPKFHGGLERLRASVRYAPSAGKLGAMLGHNASAARRFRGRYLRALLHVIVRPHRRLVWRFLQGGYVAEHAARYGVDHLHAHFATEAYDRGIAGLDDYRASVQLHRPRV